MSTYPKLRDRTLDENHGSSLMAAVSLTLQLGANKPDDGPMVRLGYPLLSAVASALEIMDDPNLDAGMVAYCAVQAAKRQGLILHQVPDGLGPTLDRQTERDGLT